MATLITKNSSTAAAVPGTGDLVQGELAVNVTDKKLYTKDSGGSIVKVVGSLGNQEANAVAITGGTISGVANMVSSSYQEFTSSGTWTKPSGANFVYVEAIGGGGSGRRDLAGTMAGGGGGGLFVSGVFRASDLGATVAVTVGSGGASRTLTDQNGAIGGNSTFGSHLTAYGGGGGDSSGRTGKAGNILGAFQGVPPEMSGYYAGQGSWSTGYDGGDTIYGGAGGGAAIAGGPSYSNGGTSLYGGAGGNGGSTGTAGAVPGGGGGGGLSTSGAGGNGRIRVWTW